MGASGEAQTHYYKVGFNQGFDLRYTIPLQRTDGSQDLLVLDHHYGLWNNYYFTYQALRRGGSSEAECVQQLGGRIVSSTRSGLKYNLAKMDAEIGILTMVITPEARVASVLRRPPAAPISGLLHGAGNAPGSLK